MLRLRVFIPLAAFFLLAAVVSCQKEATAPGTEGNGQTKLNVFLTDGPYDFQQVLIDIRQIAVKIDTCRRNGDDDHEGPGCDDEHDSLSGRCEIWDTLDIVPGVYDLVQLRNGVDTLLASSFVLNGKIERIKVTLGTANSVMVDSVVHPLNLVGGLNYVYINVGREHLDSLSSSNFNLYLDFDLSRSIRFTGGQYWLKPVLKPFGHHSSGEIEGKVRPVHSWGTIRATNGTDTVYARPWDEGEFKIRGLRAGNWDLYIDGINGYSDTTITGIPVQRGRETDLGTIRLQ